MHLFGGRYLAGGFDSFFQGAPPGTYGGVPPQDFYET
jgi:hypothetical protein